MATRALLFNMSLASRPGAGPASARPRHEAGVVIYTAEEIERMEKEQRDWEESLIREANEAANKDKAKGTGSEAKS